MNSDIANMQLQRTWPDGINAIYRSKYTNEAEILQQHSRRARRGDEEKFCLDRPTRFYFAIYSAFRVRDCL